MHNLWWMKTVLMDQKKDGDGGGGAGDGSGSDDPKYVTVEEFGKTAAKIRGLEKGIKDLTTMAQNSLTMDKLIEVGLFEKGEDGTVSLKIQKKEPGSDKITDDPKLKTLQDQINALQRQNEEIKKQNEEKDKMIAEEKKSGLRKRITSEIVSALSKLNAVNPQRDAVHLLDQIKHNEEDDSLYVVSKDKYGNESNINVEDFVSAWLKGNPELVRAQTMTGSGTPGSGTGSKQGSSNGKVIPYSQWSDMNWYSQNREKFISGEFVRGDKPTPTA